MPIKFRCPHCRQFLGISRNRAGAVVDCPACGRSLRVPSSDGTVEPLLPPKLDLKDSALATALDELAMIGRVPTDANSPDHESTVAGSRAAALPTPVPQPEPIALEPPLPAERIESTSAATAKNDSDPAETATAAVPASDSIAGILRHSDREHPFHGPSSRPAGQRIGRGPLAVLILLLLAVVGSGGFLAGYFLGSRRPVPPVSSDSEKSHAGKPLANKGEAGGESAAVTGRITYRTGGGESQPDSGARVIVLPEQRAGTARLSVIGLRPADTPADLRLARAGLRAQGGDVAVVDAQGAYSIHLPRAGSYHILTLSHHQARDDADETPDVARAQSVLEAFVDRPRSLVGRLQFHLATLRYSGHGTQIWDDAFEAQR